MWRRYYRRWIYVYIRTVRFGVIYKHKWRRIRRTWKHTHTHTPTHPHTHTHTHTHTQTYTHAHCVEKTTICMSSGMGSGNMQKAVRLAVLIYNKRNSTRSCLNPSRCAWKDSIESPRNRYTYTCALHVRLKLVNSWHVNLNEKLLLAEVTCMMRMLSQLAWILVCGERNKRPCHTHCLISIKWCIYRCVVNWDALFDIAWDFAFFFRLQDAKPWKHALSESFELFDLIARAGREWGCRILTRVGFEDDLASSRDYEESVMILVKNGKRYNVNRVLHTLMQTNISSFNVRTIFCSGLHEWMNIIFKPQISRDKELVGSITFLNSPQAKTAWNIERCLRMMIILII
jgi:hypothetical protein